MTYDIIWEFRVPKPSLDALEAAYGPDGTWARLFARAPGFVEVELLRCAEEEGRYLTIDRWVSRRFFETFQEEFADDYRELDKTLKDLIMIETRLGAFENVRASELASDT
jgi:heme-degrading monooxygenase HmoA